MVERIVFFIWLLWNLIWFFFLNFYYKLPNINQQSNEKLLQKAVGKAKRLAIDGKPLLIKMNSYPTSGKSTFINTHNHMYRNCRLFDFDDFEGDQKTISLLLDKSKRNKKTNMILFGTNSDYRDDVDVIFISVVPSIYNLYHNFISRQFATNHGYKNPLLIMVERYYRFKLALKHNQYIASDFKNPIDILINAYEHPR